ncbi:alpha/beta hydrolase [Kribbella solani]|uniref:alpha/beta hydrolase n=1 Tax=Kribbella solani TaxID=236067 RepID=UPI0029AC3549|nr:alpha/beta hydrolase [Kribbella solani]MDX2972454.1 alpha/beta hydrolase [Kribbella solani]MDX3001647.1 alpha/beta hydrolase [Kribbella solani]
MWKSLTAASIAGAVLVAAVGVNTAAAAGTLDWKACKPGAIEQCATLKVPLDWSKPAGSTTDVFVAKVPAKDQKHKLGALFFNPGGPGGAGGSIFAAGLADVILPQFRDKYDLISFDPRGTGSSSQLDCGPVLRQGVPVFPKSAAEYDAMVASSRATGEQCLKQHGELMRNLDTRSVARDMDAIRGALGEAKFNYIGLSYGSYLGTIYAQQFPQRVGRMVLDGIVDHKQGALKFMLDEARTMEDSFNRFAAWCAKDTSCALHGQDVGDVYDATLRTADKTPLKGPKGPVTGDVIRMAVPTLLPLTAMVSDNWPALATALAKAAKGDGTDFANVSYLGDPETAYAAVSCMDLPGELRGYADARARLALAKSVAPRLGASVEGWALTAACSGWPIPPSNPWQATPVHGAAPILITSTLHDPSTPVTNARSLNRQIDGSRLLTADAVGHTAYFNSACARDRIADYLLKGKLPTKTC